MVFRDYPVVPTPVDPARIADRRTATSARKRRLHDQLGVGTGTAILLRRSPARLTCGVARAVPRVAGSTCGGCARRWRRSC
jgi:hypothetical protein